MKHIKFAAVIAAAALALGGCTAELDEKDIDILVENANSLIGDLIIESSAAYTEAVPETCAAAGETTEETVDYSYEVTYTFRSDKYLHEHFEKHGAEFGYTTEQEYVEGANSVIISADALHKTEAEDGDDIYYIEETNEFVVVSPDGYIRTYFKPTRGIDYYYAQ